MRPGKTPYGGISGLVKGQPLISTEKRPTR